MNRALHVNKENILNQAVSGAADLALCATAGFYHQAMHSLLKRVGHFTFCISLLLILSLSPKFGLRPKVSQKWSRLDSAIYWAFRWDETSDWTIAESEAN